mmetsp:Transcript_22199/g.51260  ORF Transcript_22199/g.51260 Transcript_22199/m.51260 type:complete len:218 (-) Transcript_22199:562-1215(-)
MGIVRATHGRRRGTSSLRGTVLCATLLRSSRGRVDAFRRVRVPARRRILRGSALVTSTTSTTSTTIAAAADSPLARVVMCVSLRVAWVADVPLNEQLDRRLGVGPHVTQHRADLFACRVGAAQRHQFLLLRLLGLVRGAQHPPSRRATAGSPQHDGYRRHHRVEVVGLAHRVVVHFAVVAHVQRCARERRHGRMNLEAWCRQLVHDDVAVIVLRGGK